jgi:hypothetical protein
MFLEQKRLSKNQIMQKSLNENINKITQLTKQAIVFQVNENSQNIDVTTISEVLAYCSLPSAAGPSVCMKGTFFM